MPKPTRVDGKAMLPVFAQNERAGLLQDIDQSIYGGGQAPPMPTPTPSPTPIPRTGSWWMRMLGLA